MEMPLLRLARATVGTYVGACDCPSAVAAALSPAGNLCLSACTTSQRCCPTCDQGLLQPWRRLMGAQPSLSPPLMACLADAPSCSTAGMEGPGPSRCRPMACLPPPPLGCLAGRPASWRRAAAASSGEHPGPPGAKGRHAAVVKQYTGGSAQWPKAVESGRARADCLCPFMQGAGAAPSAQRHCDCAHAHGRGAGSRCWPDRCAPGACGPTGWRGCSEPPPQPGPPGPGNGQNGH